MNKVIKIKEKKSNELILSYQEQISLVNKIYLGEENDETNDISREIKKKIGGYKNQDIKKKIYNEHKLISYEEVIEKLVICKLKCHYCFIRMNILFSMARDETQWSLDRIDNDKCHSNENTVISCLKCNLQRRCQDMKKFTFTKQLKINKIDK